MSTPPSVTGPTGTGSALARLILKPDYADKGKRRKRPVKRRVPPPYGRRHF